MAKWEYFLIDFEDGSHAHLYAREIAKLKEDAENVRKQLMALAEVLKDLNQAVQIIEALST